MTQNSKWTYRLWQETIKKQLSSWTMYIPGVSSSAEMTEVKIFDTILSAMSPKELDNIDELNGEAKVNLAKKSGKTIDEVNRLVHCYKQSMVLSTWLQLKKGLNEKLPTTEAEMIRMQEKESIRVRTIFAKM
jgi:signal recognition particle GTPase